MAQVTRAKTHTPTTVIYNTLEGLDFDNVASVGAGVANTTVQARLPIPANYKIYRITLNGSAFGSGGTHSFNIVLGNGAESGTAAPSDNSETAGYPPTVASAGQSAFATDKAVALTGDTPQTFTPDNPDAIYPAGGLLTLRCVTPASTGGFTNLKVVLAGAFVDINPQKPINAALNFSTDL